MDDLPPPPVPADCDLRAFQYLPLDVVRLRDSELSAAASGDEFRAAVLLWCASWHQLPASSLPKDDRALAHLAGYGRDLKGWSKVRDGAMRGWQEANDGRLYHRVVSEKAAEAWKARLEQRTRTEAARAAREAKRKQGSPTTTDHAGHVTTDDVSSSVTESVTDNATGSKGEGREREGKGEGRDYNTPPPPSAAPARADAPAPPGGERRRITGLRPAEVAKAVTAGDLVALVRAFGGSSPASPEWIRDAAGMQLGELAAVLWLAMREGSPIRQPSGLRRARQAWAQETPEERRAIAADAAGELGIQGPRAQVEVLT